MELFSVTIRWLGSAAQWVAFGLMLLVWVVLAGGFVNAAAAAAWRMGPLGALLSAAAAGVLVQTALWLAVPALAPGGGAAVLSSGLWPGAAASCSVDGLACLIA